MERQSLEIMKNFSLLCFCFVVFFTSCNIDDDLIEDYQEPSITILDTESIPKSLFFSKTHQFKAKFLNDVGETKEGLITWKSSDESVITINAAGLVAAVGVVHQPLVHLQQTTIQIQMITL